MLFYDQLLIFFGILRRMKLEPLPPLRVPIATTALTGVDPAAAFTFGFESMVCRTQYHYKLINLHTAIEGFFYEFLGQSMMTFKRASAA
jgi:hypothetical protein